MNNKNQIQDFELLLDEVFAVLQNILMERKAASLKAGKNEKTPNLFGSVHIIKTAQSLTSKEAELLEQIALGREEALTALRKNEMEIGAQAIHHARERLLTSKISREGMLIGETYQFAAEAYLHLKNRKFEQAIDFTKKAMDVHKELFLQYQQPIEARRIHLAKNISKVLGVSGQPTASIEITSKLVLHILGTPQSWPLENAQLDNPDVLPDEIKFFLLDQVLSEVGYSLSTAKEKENPIFMVVEDLITQLDKQENAPFDAVLLWLKAKKALFFNDKIKFLQTLKSFLKTDINYLPQVFQSMVKDLEKIALG